MLIRYILTLLPTGMIPVLFSTRRFDLAEENVPPFSPRYTGDAEELKDNTATNRLPDLWTSLLYVDTLDIEEA